ncbi:FtsX-like permease family protein [Rubellimicrobium aerolatum]|uniref:FtsX-like permease family protein n=1 Tax=Rubellimicrobium aerolatum TaxID=490979 RepID=A0ABW0SDR1_9RHOB|nr:FtsX-like permease family protein [Rubellimicrobium aerolatum]MBP1806557.1 putative ABC transport system permease protein [Rubellimicrobium aerolatum]
MTRAGLHALLSHWRRHPLQLFTLLAGLALATALWSGVQAINTEARASYAQAADTLGEGRLTRLLPPEGATIPEATWVALRRAGWLASPLVEGRLGPARLLGIDPLTTPVQTGPIEEADTADLQAFLAPQGALLGREDTLAALPDTGATPIPSPDAAPGTVLTDITTAQRLLGLDGFTSLLLAPDQPRRQTPLAQVAPTLRLQPPDQSTDPAALTDSFHLNITAFGLLSFAVGLFIVHGAVGLAFEQRRPTVRTLRALGMPLRALIALMALELALLALLAGALGLLLGYLIAAALLPDVAGTLRGLYGAEVAGTLTFRPLWALSGLAIALAGTAVAAASALRRLATTPLLAGGTRRAGARWAARRARTQGLVGAALLLLSLALGLWGGGLVGGFATLGTLMIGGALLLPLLLDRVLALGQHLARNPLPQWIWADARSELPGLSLALMALLLAMAANVGVSTMVSSFRQTFTGFLDQRLAPELYVGVSTPAQAEALLAALPGTVRALPIASVDRPLAGLPAEVQILRDDPTYRENWRFLSAAPDPWDQLAAGQGVLVNEQLARRAGLAVGDPLAVTDALTLPILGIYGDYGNAVGQAILTEPLFRDAFPEVVPLSFGLRLPPADVPALAESLTTDLGLDPARVVNQSNLKAISLGIFERTFAVTAALNVLTLAVAGFALLMSLLTLASIRLPQLAPVWALGTRRATLGRLELLRAVGLSALTALAALPLGLALAWVLLAVVNVEAFGWRLPMFLFPLDWLRLLALALLAAALAALWPAIRLARVPPSLLLKVFSDER